MSDWISVKDKLPIDGSRVLAYGLWEGEINSKEKVKSVHHVQISNNGEWVVLGTDAYAAWLESVTHWMPLPAPPKD